MSKRMQKTKRTIRKINKINQLNIQKNHLQITAINHHPKRRFSRFLITLLQVLFDNKIDYIVVTIVQYKIFRLHVCNHDWNDITGCRVLLRDLVVCSLRQNPVASAGIKPWRDTFGPCNRTEENQRRVA
jgi:hypothetical protein